MNDYEEELVDVWIAIHRMATLQSLFSDNIPQISEQIVEDTSTIKTFIERYCKGEVGSNMEELPACEEVIATVLWEQGLDEVLLNNIPRLRKLDEDGTSYISYNRLILNENDEEVEIRDYLGENFWCCLVEVYGDYGCTMCGGWIEDKQRFFKMLRTIQEWRQ